MKKLFVFVFAVLWFVTMNLAACSDDKKPSAGKSDRSKSDWSAQSAVDDIEAMKKAGEKGKAPEPAGAAEKK